MLWGFGFLVFILLEASLSAAVQQRKTTAEEKTLNDGDSYTFTSKNYPNDVDEWLHQKWTVKSATGKNINLICSDIRLFENDPCGDYALVITDGGKSEEICESIFTFNKISTASTLVIELRTGAWPRGFVNCTASVGETGNTRPPTIQPIPGPAYPHLALKEEGDLIDSSEHGLDPGPKNTTCRCGWANKQNQRIINGRYSGVNQFPFIGLMVLKSANNFPFCGSSIITSWHVISAAHCTVDRSAENLAIVAAEHDVTTDTETPHTRVLDVAKIINHEAYSGRSFKNDISLLLLTSKIEFNDFIGRVCLPTGHPPIDNEYTKTIGWGRTTNANYLGSQVLKHVYLRALSAELCHKVRSEIPLENPTQLCTWGKNKSACSGDSGGPIVWLDPDTNRYTLIGIVSYGSSECANDIPRVSTRVSSYLDWIERNIKDTQPEEVCTKEN